MSFIHSASSAVGWKSKPQPFPCCCKLLQNLVSCCRTPVWCKVLGESWNDGEMWRSFVASPCLNVTPDRACEDVSSSTVSSSSWAERCAQWQYLQLPILGIFHKYHHKILDLLRFVTMSCSLQVAGTFLNQMSSGKAWEAAAAAGNLYCISSTTGVTWAVLATRVWVEPQAVLQEYNAITEEFEDVMLGGS